jgi:tetratricopeptide (TPR) repeat protein
MKNIFIAIAIVSIASCTSTNKISNTAILNQEVIQNNDTMLLGRNSISQLYKQPYARWFVPNYNNYVVDSSTVLKIAPLLQDKKIEIFLGTWCGDTKREVPRMIKILQLAKVDTSNIHLIFVNREDDNRKQSPQHEEKGKFIHNVATFIIYENQKEIGRIVETPLETFEKDLATILTKTPYTPKYKALYYWNKNVKNKSQLMNDESILNYAVTLKPIVKHSGELNSFGYVLMAAKKYNEALNIFKINCSIYPSVANVFDSLGEAYFTLNDKVNAKLMYEKVLQLEPTNANAKLMLQKL